MIQGRMMQRSKITKKLFEISINNGVDKLLGAWGADNLMLGENQWTPLIMNASQCK
jgi:hypothetical protein